MDTSNLESIPSRFIAFVSALLSAILDMLFLAAWVVIHQGAEILFHVIGSLPGMEGWIVVGFKYVFYASTLLLVLTFVVRDLLTSIRRIWCAP